MFKCKKLNYILLYLLSFSFILISIASVPLYVNVSTAPALQHTVAASKTSGHDSVGIVMRSFSDVPEAEMLYKYHFLQNIETKRLGDEIASFLLTDLFVPSVYPLASVFGKDASHGNSSLKIVSFQHENDGML